MKTLGLGELSDTNIMKGMQVVEVDSKPEECKLRKYYKLLGYKDEMFYTFSSFTTKSQHKVLNIFSIHFISIHGRLESLHPRNRLISVQHIAE